MTDAQQMASFHLVQNTNTYVTVILPMAVRKLYTYYVPEDWIKEVKFGVRVEVQFGQQRLYTGLVVEVHSNPPEGYKAKPISAVLDEAPLIHPQQ